MQQQQAGSRAAVGLAGEEPQQQQQQRHPQQHARLHAAVPPQHSLALRPAENVPVYVMLPLDTVSAAAAQLGWCGGGVCVGA
jgi:hypothetical protein